MVIGLGIFFGLLLLVLLDCLFQLIRNNVVYDIRAEIMNKDYNTFLNLPSYDDMMNQWTMWTVKSYLEKYRLNKRRP